MRKITRRNIGRRVLTIADNTLEFTGKVLTGLAVGMIIADHMK